MFKHKNQISDFSELDLKLETKYKTKIQDICPCCNNRTYINPQLEFFRNDEIKNLPISKNSQTILLSLNCLEMCAKCGLIFTRKFTDTNFYYEFINTYYGMAGYPPSDEVLELQLEKYKKIKQLITPIKTKNFFKPLKFLEVSSFYGVGLKQFSKQFDVTGIEPAYLAAKFSAEDTLLKNKVINDTYENSLHLLEKYDLVLFTHSFRQIADQQLLLDSLPKILTKNGIIAITEGVFSDFIFCESFNSNKMHFSHYKSAYWNSINLQIAMGLRGFEIIDLAFFPELNKGSSPFSIAIFRFSGKLFNTLLHDESLNLTKRIIAHHKNTLSSFQNSAT